MDQQQIHPICVSKKKAGQGISPSLFVFIGLRIVIHSNVQTFVLLIIRVFNLLPVRYVTGTNRRDPQL
jgi:hypothetical protein